MYNDRHIIVIGAGIGGLAAGALLAAEGAFVTVLEAQAFPGGCAATFRRNGCLFDAGATVGCGFHPGGPMDELGRDLGIDWPVEEERVAWQYRHGGLRLDLGRSRAEIFERFPHSLPFWKEQARLARLLWRLASGGLSWPPGNPGDLAGLLRKGVYGLPDSARLVQFAPKTALAWLAAHQLDGDREFVRFIDAQLLISAQTTSPYANALTAAIALDLPASGAWRVKGGMGRVAELLATSIEEHGGAVLYGKRAIRIDSVRKEVMGVETADGSAYAADMVLANLTPGAFAELVGNHSAVRLPNRGTSPEWSAFTLYPVMDASSFVPPECRHLQIAASGGELGEGNSIFVSFSRPGESGIAPEGLCAVTVSTHTRPEPWFAAFSRGGQEYLKLKNAYTERVLDLMASQLPGAREAIRSLEAATPLTWQRYTGRAGGYVGGYPQTSLFDVRGPSTGFDNLFLVGDSIFPGQSLPGVATGARRVVELVRRVKRVGGGQ
jgi:C-3',4' desaturase CrtD